MIGLCTRVYPACRARYSNASAIAVWCAAETALSIISSPKARTNDTLLGAQNVKSNPCTPRFPWARPHSPDGATPASNQRATTSGSASPPARSESLKPTSFATADVSPAHVQTGVRVSRSA